MTEQNMAEPKMTEPKPTLDLATFAATVPDAPGPVLESAFELLDRQTAAAIAGSTQPEPTRLRSAALVLTGPGPCTLLGSSLRAGPAWAVLHNVVAGYLGSSPDDPPADRWSGESDQMATTFAVLAMGELRESSTPERLLALAVAVEVQRRITDVAGPTLTELGWCLPSALGGIGAAVAVGRLLGLGPDRMAMAIGLAATQACGFAVADRPATALRVGKAAADGIEAATLAAHGFTATPQALEGRRGLGHLLGGGRLVRAELNRLADDLGSRWVSAPTG